MSRIIRLGTRKSELALKQAEIVKHKLSKLSPSLEVQLCPMSSAGDEDTKTSLTELGGKGVFIKTLENFDDLKLNIEGRTPNWESDRIAQIDYVILITAIAELIYFSSIPTKVTINEYIDIAKEFSTPASGKFVNGVLDNIVKDLTKQGLIVKTGRGLIT